MFRYCKEKPELLALKTVVPNLHVTKNNQHQKRSSIQKVSHLKIQKQKIMIISSSVRDEQLEVSALLERVNKLSFEDCRTGGNSPHTSDFVSPSLLSPEEDEVIQISAPLNFTEYVSAPRNSSNDRMRQIAFKQILEVDSMSKLSNIISPAATFQWDHVLISSNSNCATGPSENSLMLDGSEQNIEVILQSIHHKHQTRRKYSDSSAHHSALKAVTKATKMRNRFRSAPCSMPTSRSVPSPKGRVTKTNVKDHNLLTTKNTDFP